MLFRSDHIQVLLAQAGDHLLHRFGVHAVVQSGVFFHHLYIRRNENGRIVGVTFIDHETRTVVNGSRLGKAYSANAFELRFGGQRNPGENTRGLSPKQAPAGRDGQRKRNTSRPVSYTQLAPNQLAAVFDVSGSPLENLL